MIKMVKVFVTIIIIIIIIFCRENFHRKKSRRHHHSLRVKDFCLKKNCKKKIQKIQFVQFKIKLMQQLRNLPAAVEMNLYA